ncbi:Glycosyltransferase involved in cell wall bisynthesis [Kushneria avicenniae]|uniref:Glycosyltransferase involved in cell wall bisynthesis n=1 Tax=Kushneria avicenniae TaxID=402385 RepID=A0A1I1GNW5_9GAMM|nr:glycosyltransferase [Kushneria avicenniae]SFC13145.1 Glycosyltransferase involved in cell wall bisynthesis [Kushneria avicenniae]
MNNIWLSVIVAAYNVEKHIGEALTSILDQIDNSVEIIIVNDGSKDNTLETVESIYTSHPLGQQLRIINQKNSGVSEARNTGLEIMKGRYVAFLDGDDHVLPNYYRRLLEAIDRADCAPDIIEFDAIRFSHLKNGDHQNKSLFRINVCGNYSCVDDQYVVSNIFSHAYWFPWARIYKSKLFEGLRFPPGKSYEDMMLIPQLYLRANRLAGINEPLIGYRVNPEGITKNPSHKDLADIESVIDYYLELSASENDAFKKKMTMLVACQGALFYKSISNEMKGYLSPIKEISRVVKKVKHQKRDTDIEIPFNTRMLFVSPALSNLYSYIKKFI